jgi:hypothetical protein
VLRAAQEVQRSKVLVGYCDLMKTPAKERLAAALAKTIYADIASPGGQSGSGCSRWRHPRAPRAGRAVPRRVAAAGLEAMISPFNLGDEVLIVDPQRREVRWLRLAGDRYEPVEASELVELGPAGPSRQIDWP